MELARARREIGKVKTGQWGMGMSFPHLPSWSGIAPAAASGSAARSGGATDKLGITKEFIGSTSV